MKIRIQNWPTPESRRLGPPLATLTAGGRAMSLHADEATGDLALRNADLTGDADGGHTYQPIAAITMLGDFGARLDDGARFIAGSIPHRAESADGRLDADGARPIAMSVENVFWLAAIPADAKDAFIRFRAQDGIPVQDCCIEPDAPIAGGGFVRRLRNVFRRTPRGSAAYIGGQQ